MSERPNILYFMTDQHRADWLGCAGHQSSKHQTLIGWPTEVLGLQIFM